MAVELAERKGPTRLGSYEILRKLARGGMAELFLARAVGPQGFEKLVVLKKILPQYAAIPRFVRLFLDEAKLAAGLEHPNIAHVFDMGTVDGNYFFTMEFVHGQDVRSTLHRGWQEKRGMPIEHVVQVGRAVASALHYAHERRRPDGTLLDIVHRDVSPSNVMLSYDGTIKLLDFGVAKASNSSTKTRTGTLKGKVSYMSPEQAKGSAVDRRSDVFSLGIVLWEMITGARLFRGENDLATIQMIINQAPPAPSSLRPECPPELERILLRALATNPDERTPTARQLQVELETLARESRLDQSPVSFGTYLGELFATEIKDWQTAQETGVSLGEYVGGVPGDSLTTPVSVSDFSIFDDEVEEPELDDDDELDEDGTSLESTDTASIDLDDPAGPRVIAFARPAARTPAKPAPAVRQQVTGPQPLASQPASVSFDDKTNHARPSARRLSGEVPIVPMPPILPAAPIIPIEDDDDEGYTIRDQRVDLGLPPRPATPLPVPEPEPEPPSRPSYPAMPMPVARTDTTPIPNAFPTISRDEWTRSQAAYVPPEDLEAAIARRRLRIAAAVIGIVLIVVVIGVVLGGGRPAAVALPADAAPEVIAPMPTPPTPTPTPPTPTPTQPQVQPDAAPESPTPTPTPRPPVRPKPTTPPPKLPTRPVRPYDPNSPLPPT